MSLMHVHTELLLPASVLHRRTTPSRQYHRAWKRRRLKPLTVHNQLNPDASSPFDNIFHGFLSHFPSASSYIAASLGLALFFSNGSKKLLPNPEIPGNSGFDIGEWILFTSPTPFNRFVTLRCPSICFPGSEFLEDVNETLVKEDRHFVKLNSGRMVQPVRADGDDDGNLVYQRICVGVEDGGILSLDWPANLDFEEERGLDTTVLIVPGTADGSMERKIRLFVCDCLRRGIFPVVMNPRGTAGSPLTTARLFTAADSDDISLAVQYINKKRPWTTLIGVGWGYGANMLTKYLAESGERTPLMAATCIDNPFDLEEAMKSTIYNTDFDQRHTNGLIEILQRNKELFQGRGKRFDVEKALSASSTLEFERAISMVSYGFDTIEDFYAKSSTRDVVERVKVPVLFIQNDDGIVPLFSIPRSAIAENPYSSLLLCAYSPPRNIVVDITTFSWCQHLALEWLTAVELGLLKGRHPLFRDMDVSLNPVKRLELVESRASNRRTRLDKLLDLTNGNSKIPPLKLFGTNDMATTVHSSSMNDIEDPPFPTNGLQSEDNEVGKQPDPAVDVVAAEGTSFSDDERGQVLRTAEVVMNALDLTMPDTLSDEQKKKVLNAVGQGETLIKALQDAVPENVRGKITAAVSGILQIHGSKVQFDKLLSLGKIPDVASRLKSKVRGENTDNGEHAPTLDQKKTIDNTGDTSSQVDRGSEKFPEVEKQPSKCSQGSNTEMHQPTSNLELQGSESRTMNMNDVGSSSDNEQLSRGGTTQVSEKENVPEMSANQESSKTEGPSGADKIIGDQKEIESENRKELDSMEANNKQKFNMSNDQNKMSENYGTEDMPSPPSQISETQGIENEAENYRREEDKGPTPASSQDKGDSLRFSISQALDALTGFDDSTQVAVNSVFHVIEGMIDQLEVEKDKENEVSNENNVSGINGVSKVNEQQHAPHGANSNSIERKNTRDHHGAEDEISMVQAHGQLPPGHYLKCLYSSSETVPSCNSCISSGDPLYREYLKKYLYLKLRNTQHLDSGKASALYLDYIPEEGQWKLLGLMEQNDASVDELAIHASGFREDPSITHPRSKDTDDIVEPSYVILNSAKSKDQDELEATNIVNDNTEFGDAECNESHVFIKNLVLECLNIEVGRRASATEMDELEVKLAKEIEFVANAVSVASGKAALYIHEGNNNQSGKPDALDWENIIKAISSALQETQYLRRVVPVGVIVGASLAALKKFFNVSTSVVSNEKLWSLDHVDKSTKDFVQIEEKDTDEQLLRKRENSCNISTTVDKEENMTDLEASKNEGVMVGAVTAAIGASALLAHQTNTGTGEFSNEHQKEKGNSEGPSKLDEIPETTQNNLVTSLAEKAMSVASPVVPIKEDGEVDHERLVAMLTELGQKGGILKLVGKVALLWGGIRGAMSLTDKLISFLRIAERPLFHRILGFVFLVLLLWSPVILPFLPALMQSWTTHKPFHIAEFACIAELYVSVMIMVTLWGKRIRQYDDPLLQYGLDLASVHKFRNFFKGLIGGVALVIMIHGVNSAIGCAHVLLPTSLSSSPSETVALIKSCGRMLMLTAQGVAMATGISVVEELVFRSWLPQEIATDFGYHHGIVISGLVFALSQRSIREIPGLWLLSLILSGARQRSSGSLSLPIGLRVGILASNFILKRGNFLTYQSNFPLWVTGGRPYQPFGGVVGLAFSLALAVILYPRQPHIMKKVARVIRD